MRRAGLLCLLAVVVAGCGGGAQHASTAQRLPGRLARVWASRADAIATAIDAGDSCDAGTLADSLQQDVSERRFSVPRRYRAVLLRTVDRLANGIECQAARVTTVVTTQAPGPKHPHPPHHHGPPDHGPPGHGGDGGHGHHGGHDG